MSPRRADWLLYFRRLLTFTRRANRPIAPIPMSQETLLIPNTVAVTSAAPHPRNAQALYEYLQGRGIIERLVAANALEGVSSGGVGTRTLTVNWDSLMKDIEPTTAKLNEIFLR